MDFFDKLGKKASQTYKYTTEKTSKLAKEAKLRMTMNEQKAQIEDKYMAIGKKVYERHIAQDNLDIDIEAVVEEECIEIDELCDRIDEERKELLTLRDKKQCANCFYEIELEYQYCPNCGDKQEETQDNSKEDNSIETVEQRKEEQEIVEVEEE